MQDKTSIEKSYTIDAGKLPAISANFTPATILELQGLDGKSRIRVHSSGKVELINCSDADEAARIFWSAVERMGLKLTAPEAAPAAVAVPDGWKLVPVDPTEQMGQAAADYLGECVKAWGLWKAMIACAPECAALAATPAAAPGKLGDDMQMRCRKCGEQVKIEFNSARIVTHNPHTGKPRDARDVESDPEGKLIVAPGPLFAAAAPVVLPEPDAVISELMGLVDEWGMESHLRGEAELDAQHSEATQEEIDCAKDRASKERAAWKAIESKLRALLAAGGEAQAAPAFYAALGSNGCALPQYSAGTEEGVILNVLSVARNEGYTGSGLDRLIELGWVVRPVYTRPTPATADSLATATGLPAQAVALKLIEAINTACGGNEWQGDALATDLLEPACRAVSSLAPRAQEDARLRLVRQAVRDFHYALDNRKHGGVAAGAAMNAIELALNMYWQQGQEADRRANQAAQGGE